MSIIRNAAVFAVIWGAALTAQQFDPALLLKPPVDSWPTYHGDYTGQRHSKLSAITPANVGQLALAWAFQTNQTQQIKSTPIVVNGTMYITTPYGRVVALNRNTGKVVWKRDLGYLAASSPASASPAASAWATPDMAEKIMLAKTTVQADEKEALQAMTSRASFPASRAARCSRRRATTRSRPRSRSRWARCR